VIKISCRIQEILSQRHSGVSASMLPVFHALSFAPFVELDEEPDRADRLDRMSGFWNHNPRRARRQLKLRTERVDTVDYFPFNYLDLCPDTGLC
jgi:hypothetical protein